MGQKPSLRRFIIRLCRRHARRTDDVGEAARRLLEADPTHETVEQWLTDLHLMAEVAWKISPDGNRYLYSLSMQGAAVAVNHLFDTLDAQGFIDRIREERLA